MNNLIIVESPNKAREIDKFLRQSGQYTVKSSIGHIRDLPRNNESILIKKESDDSFVFEPHYETNPDKKKVIAELKAAVKESDAIYLASDPDREGEAIAWHLKEVLAPYATGKKFNRITYNEVTPSAVRRALEEPREINMDIVDAQQSRRILDRLVGYKVSPLLWQNIKCPNNKTLSAGRVQSVALRLLVERQREIEAFDSKVFFVMAVEAKKRDTKETFTAKLSRFDGKKPEIGDRQIVDNVLLDLADASLEVDDIADRPKQRNPFPPFTTSTLQQSASSFLGFSPDKTMRLAQELFEKGKISYHRTDSINISPEASRQAKEYIVGTFGPEYAPDKVNTAKGKASKMKIQAAHEAIRPAIHRGIFETPSEVESNGDLSVQHVKLYTLIWNRFIASQMSPAKTVVTTVSLKPVKNGLHHEYIFTASKTSVLFDGFLKVWAAKLKEDDKEDSDEVKSLPELKVGEELEVLRWLAEEKKTKPPKNYSEASLIKTLEENGVGRPSTYAATIETLKVRQYAELKNKKLIPTERGRMVCDWLVEKLSSLFNVGYTAEMEAELDKVEAGTQRMNKMLSEFYVKFLSAVENCRPPAPKKEDVQLVFSLLGEITRWKQPVSKGKQVYDDKAFVESIRKKFDSGREMTMRQLDVLVRIVMAYAPQIKDAEPRLKQAGLLAGSAPAVERADNENVKYAFSVIDRIDSFSKNAFIKSLRSQYERGRELSVKQYAVLAKTAVENCGALEDCAEIRARLQQFVPEGFSPKTADPSIGGILKLLETVTQWNPRVRRGRKVYDDRNFYESLKNQFAQKGSLSDLQVKSLKRLAYSYRAKIPDYEKSSLSLGLNGDSAKSEENAVPEGQ